ncbi:MAG: hypothetical protein H0V64_02525 [Geodermatophilaceae bacterium]|jgi:hypothetical protein|nr:hypothetical protein [Geodermatophilaceae bacterium]MDQ3463435.1 hypothetical protein [Actinomycetota bacterium]
MSSESSGGVVPEDTPAAEERTGETVEEGVDVAAAGTQHGGTERPPEDAHPKEAPVEQVRDDPDMTGKSG